MATLNQCFFIGRLGNNPDEIKVTKEGKPFTRFSLAVDQGKDQPTMWLQIIAWEKQAEFVEKHVSKGTSVFVQGRLQMQKYKDRNKVERLSVEINGTNVQLLEKREKQEGDQLPDEILPEA